MSKIVFGRKVRRQKKRFSDWISTHLELTRPITSEKELKEEAENFDIFVCGSDQIWRLPERGFYFLDFTPEHVRRVAYAPSFGNIGFDEPSKALIRSYLRRFDALTVRENDGAAFVSGLLDREVPTVLDPTLLWPSSYWRKHAAEPGGRVPKRFVLIFSIQDTIPCFRAAQKICKRLGLSPVIIDTARRLVWHPFLKNHFDAGPAEFLRLIDLADFVVTSSFHGTAFAVNYGKPFLTICRGGTENVNSRIHTLADTLGTRDRLICPGEGIPECVFQDLEPEVCFRLTEQQSRCHNILTQSLLFPNADQDVGNSGKSGVIGI
jgi:hypothetical protein